MDEDIFDGEGWNFSDHNSAEGIGNAGVDTDEGEGGIEDVVFVELDLRVLGELLKAPFVVFARIVAGEVCGCDICNCFAVDAYELCRVSL